jgi:predicted PurR-regulated permease PerM
MALRTVWEPHPRFSAIRGACSPRALEVGGAISGYVTGNLAVSLICGVTSFIVLWVLGMPYAAPLALLVALLDLIPLLCSC